MILFFLLIFVLFSVSNASFDNTYAIIVDTSVGYHNYRHLTNALLFRESLIDADISSSQISTWIGEDVSSNSRNDQSGSITTGKDNVDLMRLSGSSGLPYFDFVDDEVNPSTFQTFLIGDFPRIYPPNKTLKSNNSSLLIMYLTGHGGAEFMKWRDIEDISAVEFARWIRQMYSLQRFGHLIIILDTCRAESFLRVVYDQFPEQENDRPLSLVFSSGLSENSYSYQATMSGISHVDRFTYLFVQEVKKKPCRLLSQILGSLDVKQVRSRPGLIGKDMRYCDILHPS